MLSSSSYEGFVAKEHLAVSLSPRTWTSLSRNGGKALSIGCQSTIATQWYSLLTGECVYYSLFNTTQSIPISLARHIIQSNEIIIPCLFVFKKNSAFFASLLGYVCIYMYTVCDTPCTELLIISAVYIVRWKHSSSLWASSRERTG